MKHTPNQSALYLGGKASASAKRPAKSSASPVRFETCEPRVLFSTVSGTLFNDANANGVRDSGETALSNWSVFIDANNDGALNSGEKSVKTNASGQYSFTGLAAGMYRIREVVQSGFNLTTPLISNPFNLTHQYDFNGNYNDVYAGPKMIPAGGSITSTGYNFNIGQGPSLSNALSSDHWTIQMRVKLSTVAGYRSLIDFRNRTSEAGLYVNSGKLNLYPAATGSAVSVKANTFHDIVLTRDKSSKKVTGYVDGVKQFEVVDSRGDYTFAAANAIANFVRDNSTENSAGTLDQVRIYGGPLSAAQVGKLKSGVNPAPTAKGFYVDVPTASSTVTNQNFGNTNRALITGNVYADNNGNGTKDSGEAAKAGVKVYFDKNGNNAFDTAEASAVTDSAGNYKLAAPAGSGAVRIVAASGQAVTTPSGAEYNLTAVAGQAVSGKNFGVRSTATVAANHDYQLNGSYSDKFGGSSMVPNGGTLGSTGYTFGLGQGPSVSNAFSSTSTYSIELKFKLNDVNSYKSVLSLNNRVNETALYIVGGKLNFYPIALSTTVPVVANQTTHLVMTRDGNTKKVCVYVNGTKHLEFTDSGNAALLSGPNKIVHIFRDNGSENGAGFLDYVRTFNRALNQSEVTLLKNGAPSSKVATSTATMATARSAAASAAPSPSVWSQLQIKDDLI